MKPPLDLPPTIWSVLHATMRIYDDDMLWEEPAGWGKRGNETRDLHELAVRNLPETVKKYAKGYRR